MRYIIIEPLSIYDLYPCTKCLNQTMVARERDVVGHSLFSNSPQSNSTTLSHPSTSKLYFNLLQISCSASGSVCPFSIAVQTNLSNSSKIPVDFTDTELAQYDGGLASQHPHDF